MNPAGALVFPAALLPAPHNGGGHWSQRMGVCFFRVFLVVLGRLSWEAYGGSHLDFPTIV